jgi:hypothetical protein
MKTYHIKPEYQSAWGCEANDELIVNETEVNILAREWGVTVNELLDQLDEIKACTRLTVRDLLTMDVDIDVYDNVTEELAVAFCGPMELTDRGLAHFADVLDYTVEIISGDSYDYAVVDVNDPEDEDIWERKLEAAKELFEGMAGLCSATDYDLWFKPTGAYADTAPEAKVEIEDMPHLVAEIIDLFYDWIFCHGGVARNPERDEAIAEGRDPEELCQIYGCDYGDLADHIRVILKHKGIVGKED